MTPLTLRRLTGQIPHHSVRGISYLPLLSLAPRGMSFFLRRSPPVTSPGLFLRRSLPVTSPAPSLNPLSHHPNIRFNHFFVSEYPVALRPYRSKACFPSRLVAEIKFMFITYVNHSSLQIFRFFMCIMMLCKLIMSCFMAACPYA